MGCLGDIDRRDAMGAVLKFKVAFATYRTIFISRADKSMAIKPSIIWLSIRVNPRGLCIGTMFGMISLAQSC